MPTPETLKICKAMPSLPHLLRSRAKSLIERVVKELVRIPPNVSTEELEQRSNAAGDMESYHRAVEQAGQGLSQNHDEDVRAGLVESLAAMCEKLQGILDNIEKAEQPNNERAYMRPQKARRR